MGTAKFRRPDGRDGTYGQWLSELSAKWTMLSASEQTASRDAAAVRLASQIKAQDTGPTLMHIYDEIGWFGVWPADVAAALSDIKGDVEVHLNSPGGNVFDGLAIYAKLKQHPGDVSVVVDGLAASAASFIASAASPGKLQMTPNGVVMIHDAWGACMGNAADMTDMAALLEETSDNIASIYAERAGLTAPEFRQMMRTETWATGQQAVDLRLADAVRHPADATPVPAAPIQLAASVPWQVTIVNAAGKPYSPVPYRVDPGEDVKCPSCDKMNDRDAVFCDQCGRKIPASAFESVGGQTRQSYERKPDETVQCPECHKFNDPDAEYCDQCGEHLVGRTDVNESAPGSGYPYDASPSAADLRNASVDNSDWDASKAWKAGAASDDPAKFYAGICAGAKAGDKATQAAWALPYKYSPSSAPNAAGVKNALSRLPQTEGLTNKTEAQALLQRLMKQVNPDYEPDDHTDMPEWLKALTAEEAT